MKLTTTARWTLLTVSLALAAGCSTTKKDATAAKPTPVASAAGSTASATPAAAPAASPEAASAAATPAAASAPAAHGNILSRISWFIFGWPASGAPVPMSAAEVAQAKADKAFKTYAAAAADLDAQLAKGKVTPAQYKEKSAELARLYGTAN